MGKGCGMGLLQRVFGVSESTEGTPRRQPGGIATSPQPRAEPDADMPLAPRPPGDPVHIPGGYGRANVVGVTYYQDAFQGLALGATRLELRCQPDNPFDSNAVAVVVDERKIGYLSAHMAEGYQPLIRRLEREGPVVADGFVVNDGQGRAAEIELPRDERLAVWVNTEPQDRHLVGFKMFRIWLKRQGQYQAELKALLGGHSRRELSALIESFDTSTGKYKGQIGLRFTVNGLEFGLIPAQFRNQAEELFAHVEGQGPQTHPVWITRSDDEGGLSSRLDYYPRPAAS
jgi:hypothetical protein